MVVLGAFCALMITLLSALMITLLSAMLRACTHLPPCTLTLAHSTQGHLHTAQHVEWKDGGMQPLCQSERGGRCFSGLSCVVVHCGALKYQPNLIPAAYLFCSESTSSALAMHGALPPCFDSACCCGATCVGCIHA